MPPVASPTPSATSAPPDHDEIAVVAYEIWLSKGQRDGSDLDDWFEAERRLRG